MAAFLAPLILAPRLAYRTGLCQDFRHRISRECEGVRMAKTAFIGLGVMGFSMAGHLAAKGHAVTGWRPAR
jgi:hypothetical protein